MKKDFKLSIFNKIVICSTIAVCVILNVVPDQKWVFLHTLCYPVSLLVSLAIKYDCNWFLNEMLGHEWGDEVFARVLLSIFTIFQFYFISVLIEKTYQGFFKKTQYLWIPFGSKTGQLLSKSIWSLSPPKRIMMSLLLCPLPVLGSFLFLMGLLDFTWRMFELVPIIMAITATVGAAAVFVAMKLKFEMSMSTFSALGILGCNVVWLMTLSNAPAWNPQMICFNIVFFSICGGITGMVFWILARPDFIARTIKDE